LGFIRRSSDNSAVGRAKSPCDALQPNTA